MSTGPDCHSVSTGRTVSPSPSCRRIGPRNGEREHRSMRRNVIVWSFALLVVVVLAGSQVAAEERERRRAPAAAALVLPIVGTSHGGGMSFIGTLSVQRFTFSNNQIFAVGMITGTVTDSAGRPIGTFLNGPKEIPVTVSQGTSASLAPSSKVRPVSGAEGPTTRGLILVQGQQTCGVLHLEFGATTLNALGLTIATSPLTLDISGDSAGALGGLVCQILGLLTSVVNTVGLL